MLRQRLLVVLLVVGVTVGIGMAARSGVQTPVALSAEAAEAMANGLAVSGEGRVQSAPDVAYINVGVQVQGKTANEAMGLNGQKMAAIIAKLQSLGIPEADLQTSEISLFPQYNYQTKDPAGQPVLVGYMASTQVRITVNEIGKAVWVLDGAVEAGANQTFGLQFAMKDTNSLRQRALTEAARQARSRAEAIASGLGMRITGVRGASESGSSVPNPVPRAGDAVGVAAPTAGGAPVPVERGQLFITERVNVVFEVAP